MTDVFQLVTLGLILVLSFYFSSRVSVPERVRRLAYERTLAVAILGTSTFLGCMTVTALLHYPIPRIQDEFSYLLMADTFSHGHVGFPTPPLSEFFDTFHVLMRPVYASKYFPAQGVFLAAGQRLIGHPAVGVWLSAALASAASVWMLQIWIGPSWALLGGILAATQYGIFSYWSQSYWGGMVAALGGALFFGGARRLWEQFSWRNAICGAFGLAILANSRPTEGFFAIVPISVISLRQIVKQGTWMKITFWRDLILPASLVLIPTFLLMGAYNRAITGSPLKPPYVLHEEQYQESPQFTFLSLRPKITYSSTWLQYYYEINEMQLYVSQRTPKNLLLTAARKLMEWWEFYCGILLSLPLVLPALMGPRKTRYWQMFLLAGFILTAIYYDPHSEGIRFVIDLLALGEVILLWSVFDGLWPRLALGTSVLIILESFFVKWSRPHYFAPAACLVLYLQVEGLRKLWGADRETTPLFGATRSERRRAVRSTAKPLPLVSRLRGLVIMLPVACMICLVLQVLGRKNDWLDDQSESGATAHVLTLHDWSVRRAELEKWLQHQATPQLVFVRYSPNHNVNFEWVYNHADIMHSHVMWARDLGSEHNKLLLKLVPDRTVWLLEADARDPQLVRYPGWSGPTANTASVAQTAVPSTDDVQLNW